VASILIVDDDALIRQLARSTLERLGHEILIAEDGLDALTKAWERLPDVMLLDLILPELNGLEVLRKLKSNSRTCGIKIIMLTGERSDEDREKGMRLGADDFFFKPFSPLDLLNKVKSLLEASEPLVKPEGPAASDRAQPEDDPMATAILVGRSLKTQEEIEAMHREQLLMYAKDVSRLYELEAEKSTALEAALGELSQANELLLEASRDSILRLSMAAEYKDTDTGNHIRRVSRYCEIIARGLTGDEDFIRNICLASPMHDVGKIGIRESILLKPGKLTPEEFDEIKLHAVIGSRLLSGSQNVLMRMAETIALAHHEKFDGSGYPGALKGEEIPLEGRIVALADVFDALTTRRPYKDPIPLDAALDIIRNDTGKHFDPAVVGAFFQSLDEVKAVMAEFGEGAQ
jgi:putative two-component system response regulator